MKRLVLFLSVLFLSTSAICQVASETRQARINALLDEYELCKGKEPYTRGSSCLQDAMMEAAWGFDVRDEVILRYAQLEYMRRYDIKFSEENFERHALTTSIEKFEDLNRNERSCGLALIYAKMKLYRLDYLDHSSAPSELVDIIYELENISSTALEPELEMYYSILDLKINQAALNEMMLFVQNKLDAYDGVFWADAALVNYLDDKPDRIVQRCLIQADKTAKPEADAVRAYLKEQRIRDAQAVYESYLMPAEQGSVLGKIRLASCLISRGEKEEAMNILCSVQDDMYFNRYGGSIYKGVLLASENTIPSLQASLLQFQEGIDKCIFGLQRRWAREEYKKSQTKAAVLQLVQQEEMLDYDYVLPSELVAIAKGYDLYDEKEKAINLYRKAAEMGDVYSLAKVCIYDVQQGVLTQNESLTEKAAQVIIANADSWFTPFAYNAALVALYGLDGSEPNENRAAKYYRSYLRKIKKDALKDTYQEEDLLVQQMYSPSHPKSAEILEEHFEYYEDAIASFNKGLALEAKGRYRDAYWAYLSALDDNHPLASSKMKLMDRLSK